MYYLKNSRALLMLIPLMMLSFMCFSQDEDNKDLESWTAINLKYKLNKKWAFNLEGQLRLKEDISEVSEYFSEFATAYTVFKGFKLGAGFRYIRENDNVGNLQGYENHFRFNIDASYKHKIDDFSLKYRFRYQNKNELGISSSEGDYAKQNIRFKTSLEYNIGNWKLDPKVSAEIFNRFEKDEDSRFSKYRLTFGTEYKMKKIGTIGLFYRLEKELNQEVPKTTNIIGLKYTYTIKN
ncbi:uncharacterized protein DUF2490 [Maribacter vaceletii]|uniref:Uncharacterized protein DUF2490 n=1 Tax=Maribacter vaceletii TaxID=1206816 RepID=A0A495DTR6_9FLAO|nr:DUF2490 domain-containing protein [Maribacter vaceletii]RKR08055.1 uncharacterized protein DUF2490 [Maribacter vaceletii]